MGIRTCCVLVTVFLALGSGADADAAAPGASEPWDLVWYSDSTGWGVADLWAAQIEEEFGVEVRVHDHAMAVTASMPHRMAERP